MPTKRDYYDILGVSKTASDDELKKAYRKMAMEHHPDMVKDGDKKAHEEHFKEINEAYQVLSEPQKRKMYDAYGHAAGGAQGFSGANASGFGGQGFGGQQGPFTYTYSSNMGGQNPFGDVDPFEVFQDFFGFRGFGGQRQPKRGKNLSYQLEIQFVDAVKGAQKTLKVETGEITIKIPQGARDGTELRFAGRGLPGPANTPAGDLFITLRVSTPREFQDRAGDDLGVLKEIDFVTATLGGLVEIPTVDEKSSTGVAQTQLKIPSGTQHGTQFRVRGKGIPKLNGRGSGDVIVQVAIRIPQNISRQQKQALENYPR
ncbi:MAG: DnaJ C-terminal domain-containing protein [Patescibacteria group bacterium]